MARSGKSLIVGGDGLLGRRLAEYLTAAGEDVLSSTRRADLAGPKRPLLDLQTDLSTIEMPDGVAKAYLCAGVTNIEACRREPEVSRQINVLATMELARRLLAQGSFVVFLSSNKVFSGDVPLVPPETEASPLTEYGRQKAEAEASLKELGGNIAIVRLSKVLGPNSIFHQWRQNLENGKAIYPFSDMYISPIPLSTVLSVLRLVGDRESGGVLQLSGQEDVSYAQAVYWGAVSCGFPRNLIKSVTTKKSGITFEVNGRYSSLHTGRLRSEFGIDPPPVRWVVETAFSANVTNNKNA